MKVMCGKETKLGGTVFIMPQRGVMCKCSYLDKTMNLLRIYCFL